MPISGVARGAASHVARICRCLDLSDFCMAAPGKAPLSSLPLRNLLNVKPPAVLNLRPALRADCPLILRFIQALADYENLSDRVVATEAKLDQTLFGDRPGAEVVIAEWKGEPAGFALYFSNYSTFLAQAGIYLEDLFVQPDFRGHGIGKALLIHLAKLAVERDCGRLDWSVLDWNAPTIAFYRSLDAVPLDDWTQFRLEGKALNKLAGQG